MSGRDNNNDDNDDDDGKRNKKKTHTHTKRCSKATTLYDYTMYDSISFKENAHFLLVRRKEFGVVWFGLVNASAQLHAVPLSTSTILSSFRLSVSQPKYPKFAKCAHEKPDEAMKI